MPAKRGSSELRAPPRGERARDGEPAALLGSRRVRIIVAGGALGAEGRFYGLIAGGGQLRRWWPAGLPMRLAHHQRPLPGVVDGIAQKRRIYRGLPGVFVPPEMPPKYQKKDP